MEKNKAHYDLIDVHYAKLTINSDGSVAFGFPKKLQGSVSLELSAEGEQIKQRADGIDYYVVTSNNGYSGTLSMVEIPQEFKVDCLGETVDIVTGMQVENADAVQSPYALLFGFKGDKHRRRHVMYNCNASRPGIKGENKDNQKEPDMEELEFTASPLPDGTVKSSSREDTAKDIYDTWYEQVILPGQLPVSNADLADITITGVSLTPTFKSSVLSYTASTTDASNVITVTPVAASTTVEIKNGTEIIENGTSATWKSGANTITIKTTNKTANKTYTIAVTKS